MPEWFVYDNSQYYPSAEIVEADTPQQAVDAATTGGSEGIIVFPLAAVALVINGADGGSGDVVNQIRAASGW
jgi:hypothetical protein